MAADSNAAARGILKNVGGVENVVSVTRCATRIRFELKDPEQVLEKPLGQVEGVIQLSRTERGVQVVMGARTAAVYEQLVALPEMAGRAGEDAVTSRRNLLATFMDTVSGIFLPVIGVMAGAGMLKALLILCTTIGVLTEDAGTYRILWAAADGVFTYIPLFLGYTSSKKFGASPFIGMAIAAGLISQDLASAKAAGEAIDFLGIPVTLVTYTSNVMPIIFACYLSSKLERFLSGRVPSAVHFLVPMLCLVIMVPLTFVVIGPVMNWVGNLLADGYQWVVTLNPIVAGGLLGFVWPVCVMFGIQRCFVPIVMNNISKLGHDTLFVITGPNNFAQAGACLGVLLKTKRADVKEVAAPAALSALLAGTTEPAIYGINLKYKRPFYIAMVFTGIGAAIVAAAGTYVPALIDTSLLTLPAYLASGVDAFIGFVIAAAISYFGSAICSYLFGFNDSMVIDDDAESEAA